MIKGCDSENEAVESVSFSFAKENKNNCKAGWEITWSNPNPDTGNVKLASSDQLLLCF